MQKVLIIGCSGVGKSTFAVRVSERTGLPFTATDAFYWHANWQNASTESIVERVNAATSESTWILDGNFDAQHEFVWQRADTIVWLDYPLWRILLQVVNRNLGLWLSQKPTWSGNRMSLKHAGSGIRHSLKSYKLKRTKYPVYLKEFSHIKIHHFRCPSDAEAWLISQPYVD